MPTVLQVLPSLAGGGGRGAGHARHLARAGCRRLALPHRDRRGGGPGTGRRCRRAACGIAGRPPQPSAGSGCDPAPCTPDFRGGRGPRPCPLALACLARLSRGEACGAALRHHLPRRLFRRLAGQATLQRDHDAGRTGHRDLGVHRPSHRRDLRHRAGQDQDHPARRGPLGVRPRACRPREDRRAPRCVARAGGAARPHAAGARDHVEGSSRAARCAGDGRGGRLLPLRRHRRCGARWLSRPHRATDRGARN